MANTKEKDQILFWGQSRKMGELCFTLDGRGIFTVEENY